MREPGALIGREAELERLLAALARASDGRPGAVLLGGEAGIGKTRLLDELASRARAQDALVLAGRCVDLEDAAIPLLPIADALTPLVAEGLPPELAGLVAGEPWAPGAGGLGPQRVLAATAELLRGLAAERAVVLTVDDLHWADRTTLALLTFVVRRLRDERLLVVAGYRSDEVDWRAPLRRFLADVGTAGTVERLMLGPLPPADAAARLEQMVGAPPDPAWAAPILTRAAGNALFLEELAALSADEAADGFPPTLRDLLLTRLHRLGPEAQQVVRAAAACGRRVPHRLLAAVAARPDATLADALRDAVRHQVLVTAGDAYTFRHPLLREAAYGELLPGERAALHARLARLLEDRPELDAGTPATVAAEIAHHFLRAGDRPEALRAAVRAGLEADRVHAPDAALDHLRRAVGLWDAVPDAATLAGLDRADLLGRAAAAAAGAGRPGEALDLVEAALAALAADADQAGASDEHGRRTLERAGALHERRGWYLWYDGRGAEAVPAYERALALVPAGPSPARAGVLARLGLLLGLAGDPVAARGRAEEAIAVAREAGAPAEEAEALVALGPALEVLGDPDGALAGLRRASALGRELDVPLVRARAAINLSHLLRRTGALDEAIDVALAGAEDCRRSGLDFAEGGLCVANAAEAAFERGRWDLVDTLTRGHLERPGAGATRVAALHLRALLQIAQGDLDAAEAAAAEQRAMETQTLPERAAEVARHEIELALWRRRPAAALDHAEVAAQAVAASDPYVGAELAALGVRAAADAAALARDRRDAPAADATVARARALAAAVPAATPVRAAAEAELARAEGRPDAAAWEQAVAAAQDRGAPYPAAYAGWRWAEALLAGGDRTAAADALRGAHAVAQELGARLLAGELEALARAARLPVAGLADDEAPADDPFGLTPRERDVLGRLALGRTNRQIGEELFISTKTVGVHVGHILDKLGAATRGEAAAIARRQGLLDVRSDAAAGTRQT